MQILTRKIQLEYTQRVVKNGEKLSREGVACLSLEFFKTHLNSSVIEKSYCNFILFFKSQKYSNCMFAVRNQSH